MDGAAATAPSASGAPQAYDLEELYCRSLGHHLRFSYCRRAEAGDPCGRVAECWWERPEVLKTLRARYGDCLSRPSPGKLESILSIVARVRSREPAGNPWE